jgi:hypothetical protein
MKQAVAAFVISLAAVASGVCAEPQIPFPAANDRVAVPTDSPVRYAGLRTKDGETVASFGGKFLLTGTYYFGDNDFNDSGDEHASDYVFDPQAYVIPDATIATRLPYFVIRNSRQIIFLSNPVSFAKAVVPEQAARRVRCRSCGDATGHIAIWVDQFSAGIACDSPYYEARFLSVDRPTKIAVGPRPDQAC